MDRVLAVLVFLLVLAISVFTFPEEASAVLMVAVCSAVVLVVIHHTASKEEAIFLQRIFLVALLLRISFGIIVHLYELRSFFGSDSFLYDSLGNRLNEIWFGGAFTNDQVSQRALSTSSPGWGMWYLTGIIYAITGRNILAAQFFCGVVGAATAPMVYACANKIFNNKNVGKVSAIMVAVFPAFVIWSSQLLKDGIIIFLLVLSITLVINLQQKFNYLSLILLILSLFAILSLRFYIFYMVVIAVIGSFVIGSASSNQSIVKRIAAILVIGLALTYLGVLRNAEKDISYADLKKVQVSRSDLAKSAESGFGEDVDVSTTEGALYVIPLGFTYLMFAPFPWQMANARQAFVLPDIILWWCSMPFLFTGLIYTIKHRLREAIAVLLFSLLLTVAYSIFQGNVGTAYRQRTQIQVFLFMFIAVGWQLRKERKEIDKIESKARKLNLEKSIGRNHVRNGRV
jgi:Dolichyl-phosphate-mannose-protein mannosyltransferase